MPDNLQTYLEGLKGTGRAPAEAAAPPASSMPANQSATTPGPQQTPSPYDPATATGPRPGGLLNFGPANMPGTAEQNLARSSSLVSRTDAQGVQTPVDVGGALQGAAPFMPMAGSLAASMLTASRVRTLLAGMPMHPAMRLAIGLGADFISGTGGEIAGYATQLWAEGETPIEDVAGKMSQGTVDALTNNLIGTGLGAGVGLAGRHAIGNPIRRARLGAVREETAALGNRMAGRFANDPVATTDTFGRARPPADIRDEVAAGAAAVRTPLAASDVFTSDLPAVTENVILGSLTGGPLRAQRAAQRTASVTNLRGFVERLGSGGQHPRDVAEVTGLFLTHEREALTAAATNMDEFVRNTAGDTIIDMRQVNARTRRFVNERSGIVQPTRQAQATASGNVGNAGDAAVRTHAEAQVMDRARRDPAFAATLTDPAAVAAAVDAETGNWASVRKLMDDIHEANTEAAVAGSFNAMGSGPKGYEARQVSHDLTQTLDAHLRPNQAVGYAGYPQAYEAWRARNALTETKHLGFEERNILAKKYIEYAAAPGGSAEDLTDLLYKAGNDTSVEALWNSIGNAPIDRVRALVGNAKADVVQSALGPEGVGRLGQGMSQRAQAQQVLRVAYMDKIVDESITVTNGVSQINPRKFVQLLERQGQHRLNMILGPGTANELIDLMNYVNVINTRAAGNTGREVLAFRATSRLERALKAAVGLPGAMLGTSAAAGGAYAASGGDPNKAAAGAIVVGGAYLAVPNLIARAFTNPKIINHMMRLAREIDTPMAPGVGSQRTAIAGARTGRIVAHVTKLGDMISGDGESRQARRHKAQAGASFMREH